MVTLNTILYEGNFVEFLNEDSWFFRFESKYVTQKLLTINNLISTDLFNEMIAKLKLKYDFDVIFTSDYESDALTYFRLEMNRSSVGYWYSIPYFVDILAIRNPFIFNVSSDCVKSMVVDDSFFEKSIEILNSNNGYPVTTLSWGEHWGKVGVPPTIPKHITCVGEWEQLHTPSYTNDKALKDFWCSDVFSDQVFFGHVEKLKNIDYNTPKTGRYNGPKYGGSNAFEARLSEYLANNKLFRLIFKNSDLYYKHML